MKVRSNQTMGHKINRMRASGENRLLLVGSTHNGKLGALSWNLKLGGSPCSLAITEAWSVCWPDPCEDCDVGCGPWWANCNLTGRKVKPERIREYNPHSTPFFIRPWVDVFCLSFRELREIKMWTKSQQIRAENNNKQSI